MQKQFDYYYSYQELQPWSKRLIPKMTERARVGAIFFNNHVRGQAPRNALLLAEQLSAQGFSMASRD